MLHLRLPIRQNPNHVFTWLISRSYDDKGNAIIYDYVPENDSGVDTALPSEPALGLRTAT